VKKYRALELYREIDKNRDGNLKLQEVMKFVKRIVPDVTEVQAARFRAALDANGDGTVTYKEVREHRHACPWVRPQEKRAALCEGGKQSWHGRWQWIGTRKRIVRGVITKRRPTLS
jgi:hypothetical protein